ncbi:MAG: PilZ domain-containing protein [Terriglobales bacterium]
MSVGATIKTVPKYVSTRRWRRFEVDIPVRLVVCKEMKTTIFDAKGNSLGEGGMALFAGTELRMGDLGAVEFTPAYASPPIRVDATVRNRSGYNYGVEFLEATASQKRLVEEFRRHMSTLTATV